MHIKLTDCEYRYVQQRFYYFFRQGEEFTCNALLCFQVKLPWYSEDTSTPEDSPEHFQKTKTAPRKVSQKS